MKFEDLKVGEMYLIEVGELFGFTDSSNRIRPAVGEDLLKGLVIEYTAAGLSAWDKYRCTVVMTPHNNPNYKPGKLIFLAGNERVTFKKL